MDVWSEIVLAASSMSVWEVLGVVFGILSVWFSKKENILVYPTGIISVLIYVYLCYYAGLYADVGINVFYFIMSVYGWYNWVRPFSDKSLAIGSCTKGENALFVGLVGVFWLVLYYVLVAFTDSTVPAIDSFTTALCLVGMWLMALKKIENWIYLIIADVISVPLYWYKGLPLTSIQFAFFTGLAISGYLEWKGKLSEK